MLTVLAEEQGGKSLCSSATLTRLEMEAKALFAGMAEDPPSVGDAIFVEYDHAFCQKYQIGRFGRKTVKDGKVQFHAGPKQVVHPSIYLMDDHNFLDYVKQWRDGGYYPVPLDKLMQGPKWPELIEQKRSKLNSLNYEQALFRFISEVERKEITLVNPSFSTMTALKSTVGGYVTLTATSDHVWKRDVLDFINQSSGKLVMLHSKSIRGVSYLGMDVPQWYPETPWFRLILSPSVAMNKEFRNYRVSFDSERVITRYEKKNGYVVTSVLERDSPYYVMNPVTLDALAKRKDQWYYCEANFEMKVIDEDDVKVSHAPWFVSLPRGLEWEKIDGVRPMYVKHRDGVLYDVRANGTWLSKRQRIPPPIGMKWVALEKEGTHWVTYSTLRPRRHYGVRVHEVGGEKITVFDDAVLIQQLQKPDDRRVFVQEPPDEEIPFVRVVSDSPLYEVLVSTDEDRKKVKNRVKAVLADGKKYFLEAELREDGVCFLPGGQHYTIMGLGRGQLRPIQTIHTMESDYVVLPDYGGQKYLFPKAGDVEMMCSTLSLFATDWVSISQQVRGFDTDAPLVSTDEVSQKIFKEVTSKKIISLSSYAISVPILADRTGYSGPFLYRFLATVPGYVVWKIEAGVVFVTHESVLDIRQEGTINDITADGRSWISILRGDGQLREKFRFIGRRLRPLIRFLQWNYCMVHYEDKGSCIELSVRRPRK